MDENGRFERVVVVSAHPDDPEFGFGSIVAKLTDEGVDAFYVICTDGSQGGDDPSLIDAELTSMRYAEQRAAAEILGVKEVAFLGFRDGQLLASIELRRAITREIRRFKPDLVMTHMPLRALSVGITASHPDHIATGAATLSAVYPDACNPRAYPELLSEGLDPHTVKEVWLPAFDEPDQYMDVTSTVRRQRKAILCHRSQFQRLAPEPGIPATWIRERLYFVSSVTDRLRQLGERSGLGYEYAAGFRRIRIG
jgi:LmbE family N-acetylglucosaminyl deacetylase